VVQSLAGGVYCQLSNTPEHQDREDRAMTARQGDWQSFAVPGQAAKARRPSETALDHAAAWQQDEPVLSRRECHHREVHTMHRRLLGKLVTGVSPTDKGHLDRIPHPRRPVGHSSA
jgi:predicted amidohydrolase YtcJ